MRTAFLFGGAAIVGVMICLSLWGFVRIPEDAKVPLHLGIKGYGSYASRTAALVLWPLVGIAMYALGIVVMRDEAARSGLITMFAALLIILPVQIGAYVNALSKKDAPR